MHTHAHTQSTHTEVMEALLWVMGHARLLHSITCPSRRHLHLLTPPQQHSHTVKRKQTFTCTVKYFDSTTLLCPGKLNAWCLHSVHCHIFEPSISKTWYIIQYHLIPSAGLSATSCAWSFISHLNDRFRHLDQAWYSGWADTTHTAGSSKACMYF